jgi:dienelactone hydrolase
MFDALSEKLDHTLRKLRGLGKITERNIDDAVREVRLALLEADVHFQVVKDFRRSVDYLGTRPEIDTTKIAYYGMSWGGVLGAIIPAVEERLKAVVLVGGGFKISSGPKPILSIMSPG